VRVFGFVGVLGRDHLRVSAGFVPAAGEVGGGGASPKKKPRKKSRKKKKYEL
jgi:hypothetical protein